MIIWFKEWILISKVNFQFSEIYGTWWVFVEKYNGTMVENLWNTDRVTALGALRPAPIARPVKPVAAPIITHNSFSPYGRFGHLWGKISESLEPVPRVQCLICRHETFTGSLFHQFKGFDESRLLSWYVIFQEITQLCQIVLIRLWVK